MKEADSEFSRAVEALAVQAQPTTRSIKANAMERQALAKRFSLIAIGRLEAQFELRRRSPEIIEVRGHLSSDVVQTCVVTLDPVASTVETEFLRLYGETESDTSGDIDIDLEVEVPEFLVNGRIDLGEIAAEELALALDPYPRSPGAEFENA